jgi:hypothetical protein
VQLAVLAEEMAIAQLTGLQIPDAHDQDVRGRGLG